MSDKKTGLILKVPNGHVHGFEIMDFLLNLEQGQGLEIILGELNSEADEVTRLNAELAEAQEDLKTAMWRHSDGSLTLIPPSCNGGKSSLRDREGEK